MCLLALFYRAVDDAPVVVGANREEVYARPGEPPQVLDGPLRSVGGRDPVAGGTWLAVNERGVLVAVTNRRGGPLPPNPRSRGLLVRDLLGCPGSREAIELAQRELGGGRYAGCNILVADRERAAVLHGGDWLRVWPLPVGLHVLTNYDLNDTHDPRLSYASWWLGQREYGSSADCVAALQELCGQRGGEHPPVCLVGEDRGTVSSTVVALPEDLSRSVYLHAQGPPDRTPYQDYSPLLRRVIADGAGR
jgi:uncharacterized protein with NRDE domain